MATLGRIYLLQGQSSSDESEAKPSLNAAEKAFMKGLVLCEKYEYIGDIIMFTFILKFPINKLLFIFKVKW